MRGASSLLSLLVSCSVGQFMLLAETKLGYKRLDQRKEGVITN